MLVFDTSVWVEYFLGSRKGLQTEKLLTSSNESLATPIIVLVELACKYQREKIDFSAQIDFIRKNTVIIGMEDGLIPGIAKNYAQMRANSRKASMADAIILTSAESQGALLVTCDFDFKGMANVRLIV